MRYFIFSILIVSSLFSQTYCAGDQISLSHQNINQTVGAAADGYNVGDTFSLADWNGDLNGGDYNVIFIDMSASW